MVMITRTKKTKKNIRKSKKIKEMTSAPIPKTESTTRVFQQNQGHEHDVDPPKVVLLDEREMMRTSTCA